MSAHQTGHHEGQSQFGHPDVAVFCGLDVGKGTHHAVALTRDGSRVFDKELPQDETRLRELFTKLAEHGPVLMVVDQPNTIGALPIAVARAADVQVAYLPGLAMRRIADLHPGQAKTDARDAYIIAEAARTMPHTLRRVDVGEEALAELTVLVGFDDDLAAEATRLANRIRGLLTQIHPAAERVLGPKVQTKATRELLTRFGGPLGLASAGKRQLLSVARKNAPRAGEQLVEDLLAALDQQSVVVPGAKAAEAVLPRLAQSLTTVLDQREQIAAQVEEILDAHPLAPVLISMPGVGIGTAARILLEVGDASSFPTSGHLAAYAGLAPVTWRSGSSIRGEHPPRQRQQATQESVLLLSVRGVARPRLPGLLRPQTSRGEASQRRAHLPGPTLLRRPARHAPHRHPLRDPACPSSLTNSIGTPPPDRTSPASGGRLDEGPSRKGRRPAAAARRTGRSSPRLDEGPSRKGRRHDLQPRQVVTLV